MRCIMGFGESSEETCMALYPEDVQGICLLSQSMQKSLGGVSNG